VAVTAVHFFVHEEALQHRIDDAAKEIDAILADDVSHDKIQHDGPEGSTDRLKRADVIRREVDVTVFGGHWVHNDQDEIPDSHRECGKEGGSHNIQTRRGPCVQTAFVTAQQVRGSLARVEQIETGEHHLWVGLLVHVLDVLIMQKDQRRETSKERRFGGPLGSLAVARMDEA